MDSPFIVIAGWIFLTVAVICWTNWKREKKKLADIVSTPTSKISTLLREKRNSGKMVEVKGKLVTEEPLLSLFTKMECVFYHAIERDKVREVSYSSRNGSGGKRERIYYSTSTDERSSKNFFIEDETGRIPVSPEGFEVEGKTVLKKEEPRPGADEFNLGVAFKPCGEKIIAVQNIETILPVGQNAYAIGELFVGKHGPFIGADPLKEKTCLISVQSEEFMVRAGSAKTRKNLIIGIVSLIVGIFLIFWGW